MYPICSMVLFFFLFTYITRWFLLGSHVGVHLPAPWSIWGTIMAATSTPGMGGIPARDLVESTFLMQFMGLFIRIWRISGWWFQTFFIFHNIWDNPSHWLSYFSRWLKPPTRIWLFNVHGISPAMCFFEHMYATKPWVKKWNQQIHAVYIYIYDYMYKYIYTYIHIHIYIYRWDAIGIQQIIRSWFSRCKGTEVSCNFSGSKGIILWNWQYLNFTQRKLVHSVSAIYGGTYTILLNMNLKYLCWFIPLLVGGLFFLFSHILGRIIPTHELHHFSEG